jgi:hypothetical protein
MSTLTSSLPSRTVYQGEVTAPTVRSHSKAEKDQGFFARLFARIIEARQRQAMLELRRHGLRLPSELEAAGRKIGERNEDSLPFVR